MSNIVLVENSLFAAKLLHAALTQYGHKVRIALHKDAKDVIAEHPHDLILLELESDGLEILEWLRSQPKTKLTGVILLTSVSEKSTIVRAAELGVNGYLCKKTFSIVRLAELINSVQERMRQVKEKVAAARAQLAKAQTGQSSTPQSAQAATPPSSAPHGASPAAHEPPSATTAGNDLRSLKPIISRSELLKRIEDCGEIKSMSPVVARVLRLTKSENCPIEKVTRAIGQDHALALKILRLVNSTVYSRGEAVDSLHLAVKRLGLEQIQQTAMSISVIEQFSGDQRAVADDAKLDIGQFWEHAIGTGIIAAELSHERDGADPDSAFIMGILHDVGRMILAESLGSDYGRVLETARSMELPLDQVESRMVLQTHAEIMDRVLHAWKFPRQLIDPIVFHHLSPEQLRKRAPGQVEEIATLSLADRLAHALLLGSSGNDAVCPTEQFCAMLKLDPGTLDRIAGMAQETTDKLKFALLSQSNAPVWRPLRQLYAEALPESLRPLFVSAAPHYDSYRLLCNQLGDEFDDESDGERAGPNIGVLHLANPRQIETLTEAYLTQEEAKCGGDRLPLLVLSPGGKCCPEQDALTGRTYQLLPTPFVMPTFVAVLGQLMCKDKLAQAA